MKSLPDMVSIREIVDGDRPSRLAEYAINTFQLHDALFCDAKFADQPDPYRNSLGFYYAHSAAFARKKLFEHLGIGKSHMLDDLLWRGVSPLEPFSVNPQIANLDPEILRVYVEETNKLLLDTINSRFANEQALVMEFDSNLWLILTILEHQRLHLATTLPHLMSLRATSNNIRSLDTVEKDFNFIDVKGGNVSFGREFDEIIMNFGWDNEFGVRNVSVPDFIVTQHPVTIAQFQEFINADGYHNPKYWSVIGKRWKE
nr:SUMF1/EgtB/PvdO family nonheme iron enzyme [Candidatus Gracilibacteria bacterium]